jgi:hypothetical protein
MHNFIVGSVFGLTVDVVAAGSTIIALIRIGLPVILAKPLVMVQITAFQEGVGCVYWPSRRCISARERQRATDQFNHGVQVMGTLRQHLALGRAAAVQDRQLMARLDPGRRRLEILRQSVGCGPQRAHHSIVGSLSQDPSYAK